MPWIRSVILGLLGFAVVYPGGIAIGLACGLPPDFTPFQTYVWLGIVVCDGNPEHPGPILPAGRA